MRILYTPACAGGNALPELNRRPRSTTNRRPTTHVSRRRGASAADVRASDETPCHPRRRRLVGGPDRDAGAEAGRARAGRDHAAPAHRPRRPRRMVRRLQGRTQDRPRAPSGRARGERLPLHGRVGRGARDARARRRSSRARSRADDRRGVRAADVRLHARHSRHDVHRERHERRPHAPRPLRPERPGGRPGAAAERADRAAEHAPAARPRRPSRPRGALQRARLQSAHGAQRAAGRRRSKDASACRRRAASSTRCASPKSTRA